MSSINEALEKLNKLKGKKEDIEITIAENEAQVSCLKKDKDILIKAAKLLSYLSENNQRKIVELFEYTLSSGLKDLFDVTYGFRFDLKTRGDSSSADFEIQSNAFPGWSNIIMCRGKSVQEIVAVIFRLLLVKLDKKSRKIVILDEPTGGVEVDRQARMSKFLSEICEKFDIQLIVITHSEELCEYADQRLDLNGYQRKAIQQSSEE